MALFKKNKTFNYEILREGEEITLKIDTEDYPNLPSLEDDPVCMSRTVDIIAESGTVTKIVLYQKRDYEYDYNQTQIIVEIAVLYKELLKQNIVGPKAIGSGGVSGLSNPQIAEMQNVVYNLLKSDPIGAYVELRRILRREKISLDKTADPRLAENIKKYISISAYVLRRLEKIKLIGIAQPYIAGYKIGDREVYRKVFSPTIKPDFMFTKLMAAYPPEGEELDTYSVKGTEVTIFGLPESTQYLYHILPPEFTLNEDRYELLDSARKIMAEHKPKKSEFVDPQRMRQVFYNVGADLLDELSEQRGMTIRSKELEQLTEILVRYTVGFGLIEVLLQDEKIQDISINSPMGQIPIFIVHQDFDDCKTNIIPTQTEAESWASKLRMISGRPLDEANPILDTELELPGASTRVSSITYPLDPTGLAFSFRRHRDKPWTLPLFIKYRMVNSLAAGLLSFIIDGTRTMLICGTRSSGKSSFLSSLLIEIMRRYRIITIEDTLELPTNSLRKLGYNIQPMKVASALASTSSSEMSASDGIRATLRLGDSALIVGEVRSKEAKALYEAMRVGAAANVVAGTIHGDSPYGIFDRVVNDIGVPKTSFKATDICIIANPIRSAGGMKKLRRVTQITEVRKHWEDDPMLEGGFVDLMKYDSKTDQLEPSTDLISGDSDILKLIAGNIKEFAGNWTAIWDNIQLRAKIKQTQVDYCDKIDRPDLLEANFTVRCNDEYHKIAEKVKNELGELDPNRIFFEWESWLKRTLKKMSIEKT